MEVKNSSACFFSTFVEFVILTPELLVLLWVNIFLLLTPGSYVLCAMLCIYMMKMKGLHISTFLELFLLCFMNFANQIFFGQLIVKNIVNALVKHS